MTTPCVKIYEGRRCRIRALADRTVRYNYDLDLHSPGDEFECSLYSEIGEPYKARFNNVIKQFKLEIIRGVDLDEKPWCADKLVEGSKSSIKASNSNT